ncbi:MAG: hypothetical protein ACR5LD_04245 [Symbiopectobacterium sp.]
MKKLGYTTLLIGSLFSENTLATTAIPTQTLNKSLHERFPEDIKTGVLNAANNDSFLPYKIVSNTNSIEGASIDLANELGELIGVKIEYFTVGEITQHTE